MRRRMGPFELLLASPRQVKAIESSDGRHFFYVFQIVTQSNKLALNTECTLRIDNSETLVTTTNLDRNRVTIRSAIEIPLEAADYMLIIYPWFLYQRLQTALESLLEEDSYCVDTALRLFGKIPPDRRPTSLQLPHAELNARQREEVQLCSDSNLAFIWGPPGTGKTTTLGHILTELMKQGKRLLVTSTTNAAIDQALAHLAELGDAQPTLMSGRIVRVGQTEAPTFGASTNEVKNRLHAETREKIEALRSLQNERYGQITPCDLILEKLQADTQQLDLFDRVELKTLTSQDLRPIFSENYLQYVLNLPTKR